jgi:Flp pilus assembly protein TadD
MTRLLRFSSVPGLSSALAFSCVLALVAGCGGSTPEPQTQPSNGGADPVLEDEQPKGVAAASSPEVQQGIDAIQAEDYAHAKEVLKGAVAKAPDDPQAAFYLGVALAGLGENDEAMAQMRRALELKKDFTEASINYSALLLDSGHADEALAAAEAGLAHAPKDASLLQNKGLALFDLGRNEDAVPVLEQAVAAAEQDEGLRFTYAQALLASGATDRALEQLDKLAQSDTLEVLASVADQYGRAKAFDRCVTTLDKAIAKKEAGELYVRRGLCKHDDKDEAGAKSDFDKAIELDPKSPKGYYYLGQSLKALKDKKGAKKAFQKVIELDPDGKLGAAAKDAMK